MTLDQLRIFIEVAQREHLTEAANVLSLTPSAVSSSIRTLEERYETPLFNRVGRRIELNEAGRIFLTEARATLASARTAELALSELGGLKRGLLTIEASQTIANYWLPPLLVAFRKKYPQIEIRLNVGNTHNVTEAVVAGTADLGFIEGHINEEMLTITTVDEDHIIVVVPPDHPWAAGTPVTPGDLLRAQWIMREQGSGTRSAFEAMLEFAGVESKKLTIALTLPSNEAVRSAVISGPYATVMSVLVVSSQLQTGLLVKANIRLAPRAFYSLRHIARYKSKSSLALEEIIRLRDTNKF